MNQTQALESELALYESNREHAVLSPFGIVKHLLELSQRIVLLESAARPAPATSQEPINPSQTDRSWPTAERVREHSRVFLETHPNGNALADFFEFVRERERAGKGEAATALNRSVDEVAREVADRRVAKGEGCAHNAGAYYSHAADNFYCRQCRKGMGAEFYAANIDRYGGMEFEAPPVPAAPAAPGDEAAREAQARAELEWVCSYYEKKSREGACDTDWGHVAYEMVSMVRKALALSRFPRPADSKENPNADAR